MTSLRKYRSKFLITIIYFASCCPFFITMGFIFGNSDVPFKSTLELLMMMLAITTYLGIIVTCIKLQNEL